MSNKKNFVEYIVTINSKDGHHIKRIGEVSLDRLSIARNLLKEIINVKYWNAIDYPYCGLFTSKVLTEEAVEIVSDIIGKEIQNINEITFSKNTHYIEL